MAKIKKKGTSGQAKNFVTRSQAVRKLQISLPDFRRLCIFKGIYPREPRNRRKASKSATPATTFYYAKDIQYLLHEPLLKKFREHKALAKKIGRALGRGEVKDAARLERNLTPKITLDHIIKERYPTFVDALRDLDDALSMLFLFANLPSTTAVPFKTIALCQRLCHEFQHYIIISNSLRKSFLSIKGIYYQATIQGQDILWLVPYKFVQNTSGDIDFRIMGTFIEFYTTLLGFVNFRLYTTVGLIYPPKFDISSDDRGGELGAFQLQNRRIGEPKQTNGDSTNQSEQTPSLAMAKASERAQAEADKLAADVPPTEDDELDEQDEPKESNENAELIDKFETAAEGADVLAQPEMSGLGAALLFEKFTFYLARETPRQPLEFLLKAFGCKRVGWDAVLGDGAYTTDEGDPAITHQIVDRPPRVNLSEDANGVSESSNGSLKPGTRVAGRVYVQPQWVWDCINSGNVLSPEEYAPGATLPPHLSPWVKPKKGAYDPTIPLEAQEIEGEAEAAELEAELEKEVEAAEQEEEYVAKVSEIGRHAALLDLEGEVEAGEGMNVANADSEEEDASEEDDEEKGEWDGLSSHGSEDEDEDEDAKEERRHQKELEAEAAGMPFSTADAGDTPGKALKEKREQVRRKAQQKRREDEEELQRKMMMMSSQKKRKLMGQMMHGNKQRDAEAEKLRAKKRKLERGQKAAGE